MFSFDLENLLLFQMDRVNRLTGRQADKQTNKQTDRQTDDSNDKLTNCYREEWEHHGLD